MDDDFAPKMMRASALFWAMHRKTMESSGPLGKRAAHWIYDLGWTFAPGVLDTFLAPELPRNG